MCEFVFLYKNTVFVIVESIKIINTLKISQMMNKSMAASAWCVQLWASYLLTKARLAHWQKLHPGFRFERAGFDVLAMRVEGWPRHACN